jgi:hypothetical protein
MPYVATINVPGYLPMSDDPPVFDTAREAWEYLSEAHKVAADDAEAWRIDNGIEREAHEMDEMGSREGVIYASTPGYEGDHDLGLAYSVTFFTDRPSLLDEQ